MPSAVLRLALACAAAARAASRLASAAAKEFLARLHLEKTDPEIAKQNEIEYADERNTMIRNMAKAKAGDMIQWFIMGIAYITILTGTPLWVTLAVVGVFLLRYILELYFTGMYQKKM